MFTYLASHFSLHLQCLLTSCSSHLKQQFLCSGGPQACSVEAAGLLKVSKQYSSNNIMPVSFCPHREAMQVMAPVTPMSTATAREILLSDCRTECCWPDWCWVFFWGVVGTICQSNWVGCLSSAEHQDLDVVSSNSFVWGKWG